MRVRKKPWAKKELETNTLLIPNPETYKGNWQSCFGNGNPVYLEIGCGMGGFITKTASMYPLNNYVAIERVGNVIVGGMRRARENNILNIRFVLTDADFLSEMFAPQEVAGIFINFCDPWDRKKKWKKNRLTHERYLAVYKEILTPGAGVILKTDNLDLFEYSVENFDKNGFILKNVCRNLAQSDIMDNITTEYEERFMKMGLPIYRLEAFNPGGKNNWM